jgi:hypothetical protein
MNSDIDTDAFYYWLSGFIDGEGSFMIIPQNGKAHPEACIKVRDDDYEIIRDICKITGIGRVIRVGVYSKFINAKKQIKWTVASTSDCLALIEILDSHPLLAKKRRDYLVWKSFVIYTKDHGRNIDDFVIGFITKIKEAREYVDHSESIIEDIEKIRNSNK